MQSIKIVRYDNPALIGWAGCIEPEDKTWVGFVGLDGVPRFFLHRDPETGAVLPDEPDARTKALLSVRAEQTRREAWGGPVAGVLYPVIAGETFCGRVQPPAVGDSLDGIPAERLAAAG